MTRTMLKTTVAAIALCGSAAWADAHKPVTAPDAEMSQEAEASTEAGEAEMEVTQEAEAETEGTEMEMSQEADAEAELEAETDSANVAPEIDTDASRQAKAGSDGSLTDEGTEDDAVRFTEENAREATEGEINIADEGETDFSDTEPVISGDVNDEGTVAADEGRATADVTVEADKELAEGDAEENLTPAQEEDVAEVDSPEILIDEEFGGLTAGDLEGMRVYGADGVYVGDVNEIVMLDEEIAVVVGIGGFLGFFEDEKAVPLKAFVKGGTDEVRLSQMTAMEVEQQAEIEAELEELADDARLDERL